MDALRHWAALGRRRLPLRPRDHARPRPRRRLRRPMRRCCRRSPRTRCSSRLKLIAEPWDVGPGRLPGRQLPAAVRRVERPLPRRASAASGAATPASLPELAGRLLGSADLLRPRRPRPLGERQLRRRARRLHARRPRHLRPQAQRGQRRGKPRRPRRRTLGQPRRRRAERRPAGCARLRQRQRRNLLATLLPRPGHADAADGRRGRPQPGRQQQRLLPGQPDKLVPLGWYRGRRGGVPGLRRPPDRAAPPPPGPAPAPLPARQRARSGRPQGRDLARP